MISNKRQFKKPSLNQVDGEWSKRKRCRGSMIRSSSFSVPFMLLLSWLVVVVLLANECHAAQTSAAKPNQKDTRPASGAASTSTPKSSTKPIPRRERNLDHWDVDTLAFYLNLDVTTGKQLTTPPVYPDYDVAVMFYAPWCRNCHALAPYWDRIATHLKAGTSSQSKLIMALFDCERNVQHEKMCNAASITHFPTLLFVGSGPFHDTDVVSRLLLGTKRAAGPAGPSNLPNAVRFQGNWKLPDAVLDWIQTMQLLSRWHVATTKGWLRVVRNGILGTILAPLRPKKAVTASDSLPVGLPLGRASPSGAQVSVLQKQIQELTTKSKDNAKLIIRSSAIIDALLFPVGQPSQVLAVPNQTATTKNATGGSVNATSYEFNNFTDVFAVLHRNNGWELNTTSTKTDPTTYVILSCALDVMLDVCDRVSTHTTMDVAKNYPYEDIFSNYTKLELMIDGLVAKREPYCGIVEACLKNNFEPTACRPPTCPFQDPMACRYMTACLTKPIQTEYAVALKIIKEGEKFTPPAPPTVTTATTTASTTATTAKTPDQKVPLKKDDKKGLWGRA